MMLLRLRRLKKVKKIQISMTMVAARNLKKLHISSNTVKAKQVRALLLTLILEEMMLRMPMTLYQCASSTPQTMKTMKTILVFQAKF